MNVKNFPLIASFLIQLNCVFASSETLNVTVPGVFFKDTGVIENDGVFNKYASTRMLNVLIAPTQNEFSVLLSGIRPIMSPEQKEEVKQSLEDQIRINVLDIFDISLGENANQVIHDILKYSEAYNIYRFIENIQKQQIAALKRPDLLGKVIATASKITCVFGEGNGIQELSAALEMLGKKQNKKNLDGLKEVYSRVKSLLDGISDQFKVAAIEAIRTYLQAMETYCSNFSQLQSADVSTSLRELSTIKTNVNENELIAYIIAGVGSDAFSNLRALVKLLHTEPMLISLIKANPGCLVLPYFYTRRDMCINCRRMVDEFAQKMDTNLIVISKEPARTDGNTSDSTRVDLILAPDWNLSLDPFRGESLRNVCQIRFQPPAITEDLYDNFIVTNFRDGTAGVSNSPILNLQWQVSHTHDQAFS